MKQYAGIIAFRCLCFKAQFRVVTLKKPGYYFL